MYTKEEIKKMLKEMDDEYILSNHTKVSLGRMYEIVYDGIGYPSGWRKQDILNAMHKYFDCIERALRVKP